MGITDMSPAEQKERLDYYPGLLEEAKGALREHDEAYKLSTQGVKYQQAVQILMRQQSARFHLQLVTGRIDRYLEHDGYPSAELPGYQDHIDAEHHEKLERLLGTLTHVIAVLENN